MDSDLPERLSNVLKDAAQPQEATHPAPRPEDRRVHARIPFRMPVTIFQSDGSPVTAIGHDLGLGGIGVLSEYTADRGQQFRLQFRMRDRGRWRVIRAEAEVAFVHLKGEHYRLGLQFAELQPSDRQFLKTYITAHS